MGDMSVNVQTALGTTPDANAYVSASGVISYWAQRGVVITPSPDLDAAIVLATDYVDQRYKFIGRRLIGRSQRTEWPRSGAIDRDFFLIDGIPREVVDATCEYAKLLLIDKVDLSPDPNQIVVTQKSEEIGPIKESYHYARPTEISFPHFEAYYR